MSIAMGIIMYGPFALLGVYLLAMSYPLWRRIFGKSPSETTPGETQN
jgi:hypothetical protein